MLLLPQFIGSLALVAFLSSLYGMVRIRMRPSRAQTLLGLAFGLVAMLQMSAPLEMLPGVILDMRNVPIALAGAFLGWRGALLCLGMAVVTRASIGGIGMASGIMGMIIACTAGYAWNRATLSLQPRRVTQLFGFGLIVSLHMTAAILLPWEVCAAFFATAALPMALLNLLSVPIAAAFLEHERVRMLMEEREGADRPRDPQTGLARLSHFRREATALARGDNNGIIAGLVTIRLKGARALRRSLGEAMYAQLLGAMRLRLAQMVRPEQPAIAVTEDGRIVMALDFRQVAERNQVITEIRRILSDHAYRMMDAAELRISVSLQAHATPSVQELEETLTALALQRPAQAATTQCAVVGKTSSLRQSDLPAARKNVRHDRLFAAANVLFATKDG
ncbi:LytS/YhcK type 5TM receptor domain-containing protein [Roseovarius sp. S1116L3]|uniref:LytS/YhcK type 5TM receptor domain-containing protein n=1 Tax=Roseovarius roseus TaxID=3342636 RepID=UPI00372A66C7